MLYCITHGREHYPGETDRVELVGDEIDCREEEWPTVEGEVLSSHWEPAEDDRLTLATGQLGYLDSINGLVPVKVLSIDPGGDGLIRITASRPGFRRGEKVGVHVPNVTLVSREQRYVSREQVRFMRPTAFVADDGTLL